MHLVDYNMSYVGGVVRLIQVTVCWKGWKKEVEKNINHDFKNSLTAKGREEKYQYTEKNVRPRVFYELGDTEACLVVNKKQSNQHGEVEDTGKQEALPKESKSLRSWPSKLRLESPLSHRGSYLYRASSKISSINPGKKGRCGMQKRQAIPSRQGSLQFLL